MANDLPISFRAYAPADLEPCRSLWRELTERHREIYDDPAIGGDDPGPSFDNEYLKRSDLATVWVVELQGEVVGLTGLLIEGDEGQVEPMVVTERLRSQGVGRRMLEHVAAEAKQRGLSTLSIKPVARNVEAIQLFHEAGFRLLGHMDMFMELNTKREWKAGVTVHGRDFGF
ncbi:MAG: GNAT family N-acetyltransferase [Dehalococcoidia bacterium]